MEIIEGLTLIGEGHTTKQIALGLNLSPKTVERHRADSMKRIGVKDVAGLVRYAVKIGLVILISSLGSSAWYWTKVIPTAHLRISPIVVSINLL